MSSTVMAMHTFVESLQNDFVPWVNKDSAFVVPLRCRTTATRRPTGVTPNSDKIEIRTMKPKGQPACVLSYTWRRGNSFRAHWSWSKRTCGRYGTVSRRPLSVSAMSFFLRSSVFGYSITVRGRKREEKVQSFSQLVRSCFNSPCAFNNQNYH